VRACGWSLTLNSWATRELDTHLTLYAAGDASALGELRVAGVQLYGPSAAANPQIDLL
jgi:hypothetical protein